LSSVSEEAVVEHREATCCAARSSARGKLPARYRSEGSEGFDEDQVF
jgi:hypothetical protein